MRAAVWLISLAACGRFKFDARDDGGAGSDGIDAPGVGGTCNVSDVAVGRDHTCMIETGSVWCWGYNGIGQAAPGNQAGFIVAPTKVSLPEPAVQVAAGRVFSCARLASGAVYCWGDNASASLGDGTLAPRALPVRVALGGDSAIDLAAGTYFACIRRAADQAVMCWGLNEHKAAGQPSAATVDTPTVLPNTAGARALAIGHKHSCIVDATNQARCWGRNEYGQLASASLFDRSTADLATGVPTDLTAITAGGRFSCGVESTGDVRCWGRNGDGQLGQPPSLGANPTASAVVVTLATDVQATTSGACAVRTDRTLVCWGEALAGDGRLAYGEQLRLSSVTGVDKLALGYYHACTISTGGQLACWGANAQAELGRGQRALTTTPTAVPVSGSALGISGGVACATFGDELRCWGSGYVGQLGLGTREDRYEPTVVPHGLSGLLGVGVGTFHSCAWNATTVRCWGANEFGESAGNTTNLFQLTPVTIAGIVAPTQVSIGGSFSCAIDGAATKCWGANSRGELGNNSTADSPSPVTVVGLTAPTKIASGNLHTCAIDGGTVKCWGLGASGQIGDGGMSDRSIATSTGVTSATDISAAKTHTCAIAGGNVLCWGDNQTGQLGTGDLVPRYTPTMVTLPAVALTVTTSDGGTCARLANAETYCWGDNIDGQLADGTFAGQASPEHILALDNSDELVRADASGCVRRGTGVSCWGPTSVLGNGDYSNVTPAPPAGCE